MALNVLYSWQFNTTTGYNLLPLNQAALVPQGSVVYLNQISGSIALDTSGSSTYSDMILTNGVFYNISLTSTYRFFLTAITNFSSYKTSFSLTHSYSNPGVYLISLTFISSNIIFPISVFITQRKFES